VERHKSHGLKDKLRNWEVPPRYSARRLPVGETADKTVCATDVSQASAVLDSTGFKTLGDFKMHTSWRFSKNYFAKGVMTGYSDMFKDSYELATEQQ
jgi:hypothetical protein